MVAKLRELGADVIQIGASWFEADTHLREHVLRATEGPGADVPSARRVYVPPFDHPDVWDGAATLVGELERTLGDAGARLDGVVCSVGGGGLLCGVMQGLEAYHPRADERPAVLAVETAGAASLDAAVRAGKLVTLPAITSVASSLGATRVAGKALEWALRGKEDGTLCTAVVSDADAVRGALGLLDDARLLVEPACGATIAPAYNGELRRLLGQGLDDEEWSRRNIVLVVCGGSHISLEILLGLKKRFGV
jgi:L-serine/L-threonine ammonia-lyase